MNTPTISIIVPVYNVEKYLPACIESIRAQTFRDFELLLVDDGSPDNCPALCDAAAQKDDRIRVIHQKNGGLSAARNAGLDAARGEWIGFVDSDDTIAPEMYEVLLAEAKQENAQVAVCNMRLVDEQMQPVQRNWAEKERIKQRTLLTGKEALCLAWQAAIHMAQNKVYRRELWKKIRFPVGKRNEDFFTMPRICQECDRMVCIPDAFYNYLQREGSIMNSAVSLKNYDQAEAAAEYWKCLHKNELWQALSGAADRVWALTMDIYSQLSPEEQKDARSVQMCREQYTILKETAKRCEMPKGLLVKSFLLYRCPKLYLVCRNLKGKVK